MLKKNKIRKAKIGDEKILGFIQTESWKTAFADIISADDLIKYTDVNKAQEMYLNILKSNYSEISILEIGPLAYILSKILNLNSCCFFVSFYIHNYLLCVL